MYYNSQTNLVILGIYKTASTTVHDMIEKYANDDHIYLDRGAHFSIDSFMSAIGLNFDDVDVVLGIRNPWDCISSFYHAHIRMTDDTLDDYKMREFLEINQGNWRRVIERWEIDRLDDVIVFEELQESLNRLGREYDMEGLIDKPLLHQNISKNSEIDYRDFYNEADRHYVQGAFDERIKQIEEHFGIRYTFDNIIEKV